jgi:hypothetical protein
MSKAEDKFGQEMYQDWVAAKAIIEKFLVDLDPSWLSRPAELAHNSSALIARLAHAELLVCRASHMREDL